MIDDADFVENDDDGGLVKSLGKFIPKSVKNVGSAISNRVPQAIDTVVNKTKANIEKKQEEAKQQAEFAEQQLDASLQALHSNEGWMRNVMTGINNGTYKIRLFIAEDRPLLYSSFATYEEMEKSIYGRKHTVLCETGVTGISIVDLEMETTVAHKVRNRSMTFTKMNLKVKEPMGISFFDYIIRAAQELRVKNYAKAAYFLEIKFQGYNEDGTIEINPCAEYQNNGTWLYCLSLNHIQTNMTEQGATYDLSLSWREEVASIYHDGIDKLPFTLIPQGRTIGEMLTGLASELTKAYQEMYMVDGYREFEIQFQKFKYDDQEFDPSTFAIVSENEVDMNYERHFSMDGSGNATGTFGRGMTLADIIEISLANSEASQRLGKAVMTQSNLTDGSTEIKDAVIFRVITSVEYGEYNFTLGNYSMKYVLSVVPYFTQQAIISENQIIVSKDPLAQSKNIMEKRAGGYLARRYDYIYTGLNTEIINLDLDFTTAWSVLMPRLSGFGGTIESTTTHAMFRSPESITRDVTAVADARRDLMEMSALTDQVIRLDEELSTISDDTSERAMSISEQRDRMQRQLNVLTEKEQSNREIIGKLGDDAKIGMEINERNQRARIPPISENREHRRYAEELTEQERIRNSGFPIPITIAQSNSDTRYQHTGVVPDKYHRDRSIYGAIMDQLYETGGGALQNISMEIVGDPFWLGVGNIERSYGAFHSSRPDSNNVKQQTIMATDKHMINMDDGDLLFFLTFKYPQGFDEDSNNVYFKDNDVFTGIYKVVKVTHRFSGGMYRQVIDAIRMPLMYMISQAGKDNE